MIKRDPSKFLLFGFMGLLILCVLQVGWWITDNLYFTREMRTHFEQLLDGGRDRPEQCPLRARKRAFIVATGAPAKGQ